MRLAGGIQVSRLYSVPGLIIESPKVNCFCDQEERAVIRFTESIQWIKAAIGKKA
jgi:hypothetical protein